MIEGILTFCSYIGLSNAIAFLALGVSIISLFWSRSADKNRNNLTKQINSKEYQLKENQKEVTVRIITVVRAVNAKAAVAIENENSLHKFDYTIDYSYEIQLISEILSSPEYILFLKDIEDDEKRYEMERYFHKLVLVLSSIREPGDLQKIRSWSLLIMKQLKYYNVIETIKDRKIRRIIDDFCGMQGILTKDIN